MSVEKRQGIVFLNVLFWYRDEAPFDWNGAAQNRVADSRVWFEYGWTLVYSG